MSNRFPVNSVPVNDNVLAAIPPAGEFEGGSVIFFEQTVSNTFESGPVIFFEQTVEFTGTAEGSVMFFEQSVSNSFEGGPCIQFEQTVSDIADVGKCFVSDWDLIITVNGARVPNTQLIDKVEVVRGENDSSVMMFTVRPPVGVQDPCDYQGKTVTVDVVKQGVITRIYTGIVDYPTYDLVGERISYRCTDRRRELVNAQLKTVVKSIGYYSIPIFGEPEDTADELDKRLTTVPLSVDFDAFGNYTLTNLLPKSTPDFVISTSDIFRRDPRVEVASRGRLVNKFTINMEYRLNRLHQHSIEFNWPGFIGGSIGITDYVCAGAYLPRRDLIESAASGSDWKITGDLETEPMWPAQWVGCSGTLVAYSPWEYTSVSEERSSTGYTITDWSKAFAISANWRGTKRWSQTLSEKYAVTLEAPQSIAKYGIVERERSYGVESQFDDKDFEQGKITNDLGPYASYAELVPGTLNSYYIDYSDNRSEFSEAYNTAVNIGKTAIITSHRDNRIILETPLEPAYDLKHTIEVASNKVDGRGKVSKVSHVFDISNKDAFTEVELSLSKATGSASDSILSIPAVPATPPQQIPNVILGTRLGQDPTVPSAQSWTGWIGNKFVNNPLDRGVHLTQYPMAFVVKGPDTPPALRDNLEAPTGATFTVELQDDPMEIAFIGDCG